MTNVQYIIPFRDRGRDANRVYNRNAVVTYLEEYLDVDWAVVSDQDPHSGQSFDPDEQFNRSRAYNNARRNYPEADVYVFYESDLLVHEDQLAQGIDMALEEPGLAVPFTRFMALDEEESTETRVAIEEGSFDIGDLWDSGTQQRGYAKSIGAVNICSSETLYEIGGFDESFCGAWHDDDAMCRAFKICCGAETRFVDGPGYHLYHLPGATGDHLTDEDRAATQRNKERWLKYKRATTPRQIRRLTRGEG